MKIHNIFVACSPPGQPAVSGIVPLFSEIADPGRPCYVFLCVPGSLTSTRSSNYTWVERFKQDRCCQYENETILIGQKNLLTHPTDPCVQIEVSCNLPSNNEPKIPPKIMVEQKQIRYEPIDW